ncbi:hypothetical protein AAG747_13450 [Rapidithrix thailandica]|uniref:Lipoprotein n=1 Tax=Rapidithrix thailandica TaxID=413964 RepID=A0AAW9RVN5_9BACT
MKILLNSYKNGLFVLLMGIFFLSSCEEKKKTDQTNTETEPQEVSEGEWQYRDELSHLPLEQQITVLYDSLQSLKAQAMASEKTKLHSTQLFVEEIELLNKPYDAQKLETVKNAQNTLKEQVYDSVSFSDVQVMERYDNATEKLIAALNDFAENTENFDKFERANILLNEVIVADKNDFTLRKDYNSFAQELNSLLEEKKAEVQQLGEAFKSMQPVSFFYGEPMM